MSELSLFEVKKAMLSRN